jgi:OmcA/MtrC family decaheme c-type cytochrome
MKRLGTCSVLLVLPLAALLSGCGSTTDKTGVPPPIASPGVTGNLHSEILGVTVASAPVVTFTLFDENGAPLDPTTAGLTVRFTIARIEPDGNYRNYIAAPTPGQPGFDAGGTFDTVGDGVFTYTFNTDIDNTARTLEGIVLAGSEALTHTVSAQINRNITTDTGKTFQQAANPYHNFRPDGGAVTATREIVAISNCNECHGILGTHGGGRREITLCVLCHNPGPVDPDTGNPIDMKDLIHKIHMGEKLPSNVAGGDYAIIGFMDAVHSYKTVAFPFMSGHGAINRTPIDCAKCHREGTDLAGRPFGADVDRWKRDPTMNKCTTCHDTTTFDGSTEIVVKDIAEDVTVPAVPHSGGPIADPTGGNDPALCAGCHAVPAFEDAEYSSASVPGAHTIFEKSSLFPGIHFEIVSVANAVAGSAPTVTFRATTDNGTVISPAPPSSFTLKLGIIPDGLADYVNDNLANFGQPLSKSLAGAVDNGDGTFTDTFDQPIPAGITGVGVIGLEGRRTFNLPAHKEGAPVNVGGRSVQHYFDLATGLEVTDPALQRRQAVDINQCNLCHDRVSFHGANRVNSIEQCVICHNPGATDQGRRPASPVDNLAEQSVDFKVMIHKIHTGEDLEQQPYVIYGFGNVPHDFGEVRYPRDRRNCLACHIDATPITYGLPLPEGVVGTSVSTGEIPDDSSDDVKVLPMTATCTSCHDDTTFTAPHVANQTVGGVERCAVCHTTGLLLGPDFAHEPVR